MMTDEYIGTQEPIKPATPADQPKDDRLTQDHVNKLVGEARKEARQHGYEQAMRELNTKAPQLGTPNPVVDAQAIKQMIKEGLDEQSQNAYQVAQQQMLRQDAERKKTILTEAVIRGEKTIPDFKEVTEQIPWDEMPGVLHLVADAKGAPPEQLLYELSKNPSMLSTLLSSTAGLAKLQLQRLSDSIQRNQNASNIQVPQDPLGQIKPNNTGVDKGPKTATEWRQYYKGKIR